MLADQLATAIETAPTFKIIDNLARLTWRGMAEGHIDAIVAERLGAAVEARRVAIKGGIALSASKPASGHPGACRSRPRSPDRQRSIERRRRVACSGTVPGRLACNFTPGQTAVLSVVAQETKRRGSCQLPVDAIAALAGVCRTLVQDALREARRLGLVEVRERRRAGQPSLTNVITIISADWRAWLKLGRVQKNRHHVHNQENKRELEVDRHDAPLAYSFRSRQNQSYRQQDGAGRNATGTGVAKWSPPPKS